MTSTSLAAAPQEPGFMRRLGVAALACGLTVCILGSAAFLVWHRARNRTEDMRIERFIDSLALRTASDIAERAALLRENPDEAHRVVKAVMRELRRNPTPRMRLACVRLAQAFAGHDARVAERLFELRALPDETVAAEAIGALVALQPPQRAADYLARCLDDSPTSAVIDVVGDGLLRLGPVGRDALRPRLHRLSADRRIWLARLIAHRSPTDAATWLDLLGRDGDPQVQAAVRELRANGGQQGTGQLSAQRGSAPP